MKILITGATNGMGKGVAKVLAEREGERHEIVLLCRSRSLGEATIAELGGKGAALSLVVCDLADLGSTRLAVEEIRERYDHLDAIFVNAGIGYAARRTETVDGMDAHFQVNYLSHFFLVTRLLDLLEKSPLGGRVVFNATPGGRIFWDDVQMRKRWGYEDAIHQAMTAKRMLLATLHERYADKTAKVSFVGFSIHKTVWTNQIAVIPAPMRIMASLMRAFGRFISIEECGRIMAPLFLCGAEEIAGMSGRLVTWRKGRFEEIAEEGDVLDPGRRNELYAYSLSLCGEGPSA